MIAVWLGCLTAAAGQLPPEIMADRHMVRLDRLISEKRFREAYQLTSEVADFYEQHNLEPAHEFYFKRARIARSLGLLKETIASLQDYLNKAGREGVRYFDALKLLDRTEEELRKADAERKRLEAETRRAEALQKENTDQAERQVTAASIPLARDPMRSGGFGPEMVTVAKGRIQVTRWRKGRTLLLWVTFDSPFAIGKFEVTRGDFERFVKATRYRTEAERGLKLECFALYYRGRRNSGLKWDRPGFDQTNTHPVTCVSIRDAMAYARWLSQQTGNSYRLPSPAEWQYAARAGSQWAMLDLGLGGLDDWKAKGWTNHCGQANLPEESGKSRTHQRCLDGVKRTAPVGSYPPNGIGLHDMIGNVAELVLACIDPPDGYHIFLGFNPLESVENPNDCEKHGVAMGAAWSHASTVGYRSSYKSWSRVLANPKDEISRNSRWGVGFRVVKDF